MNPELEAKRQEWIAAEQRATDLATADAEAAAAWRAAIANRDGIFTRMATGEDLRKIDVTQANQIVQEKKLLSQVADAVARAGRLKADEMQLAYLSEVAKDFWQRHASAEERVFANAVELDRLVEKARQQAEKLHRAESRRAAIVADARMHDLGLESLVQGGQRVQPLLAQLHKSEWPRARLPNHATAHEAPQLRVELVRSERGFQTQAAGVFDRVLHQTAEQVAIASGIVPPAPPPPPPVPDAQQEPEEAEPAAEFSVAAE